MGDDIDNGTSTLDIAAASEQIGNALFPDSGSEEATETQDTPEMTGTPAVTPEVLTAMEVPTSWPKEMHEHWPKIDRKVQEYWQTREKQMLDGLTQYKTDAEYAKQFRQALSPYQQTLKNLRTDEATAARYLFQADHNLRYSQPEQKLELLKHLAKTYGVDLAGVNGQTNGQQTQTQADPEVQQLKQQFAQMQQSMLARQEAEYNTAREKVDKEVNAFAADTKAHPHFEQVAPDMAPMLQAGASLQDAYDKAVWANPVTRAKEIARVQTDHEAKLKENARLEALPKNRAKGVNVRSRDTMRSPTETVGTMEDTIKKNLRTIKERTH